MLAPAQTKSDDGPVDPSVLAGHVIADISTQVRQLSRLVTKIYDDALRPLKITSGQFTLLAHIVQNDGTMAVLIGDVLDLEKSTLSRNLKRMQKIGLITIGPRTGRNGRKHHVTAHGKAVLQQAFPLWQTAQARVTAVLGENARASLDILLTKAEAFPK